MPNYPYVYHQLHLPPVVRDSRPRTSWYRRDFAGRKLCRWGTETENLGTEKKQGKNIWISEDPAVLQDVYI